MRKFFLFPFCAFLCLLFSSANGAHPPLHVVTVGTEATPGFKRLVYSCRQNQIHLDVLGFGQTYSTKDHAKKLRWMDKYLETLPEEDLVLFVDGYDVIVLENGEEIVDRFLKLNIPVLISTAGRPYPKLLEKYKNRYPKAPASSRYLNSGLYIGSVMEVKKMIRGALSFSHLSSDDQALMSLEFLDNLENRRLDYKSEVFFTLCRVSKETVRLGNKKVEFLKTGSSPCIAHGNGKTLSYDLYIAIYRHFFNDLSDGDIVTQDMLEEQCTFLPIFVK